MRPLKSVSAPQASGPIDGNSVETRGNPRDRSNPPSTGSRSDFRDLTPARGLGSGRAPGSLGTGLGERLVELGRREADQEPASHVEDGDVAGLDAGGVQLVAHFLGDQRVV